MQQTVSGEMTKKYKFIFLKEPKNTNFISHNKYYAKLVKIFLVISNPQVTKVLSILVGTSEHIRLLSKNFKLSINNYEY